MNAGLKLECLSLAGVSNQACLQIRPEPTQVKHPSGMRGSRPYPETLDLVRRTCPEQK
jgi:hypothetical protein